MVDRISSSGRVKRLISDKIIDLESELFTLKYRKALVKAEMKRYRLAKDKKMESVFKNRLEDLCMLEKEINADIFAEVRRMFGLY